MNDIKDYPRLTTDDLPGVRRDWHDVRRRLRALGGDWAIVEEGVTYSRASSIRKTLSRYDDVKVTHRTVPGTEGLTVFAKAVSA